MIQIISTIVMIACVLLMVYGIVYATLGNIRANAFARETGKTLFSILCWVANQLLAINDWTGREIARFGTRNPRILGLLFFFTLGFILIFYNFGRFQN